MTKTRISYLLPENLHKDMLCAIQKDEYSKREKSRWVCEAIESLFKMSNFVDLVSYSDDMEEMPIKDTLTISRKLKDKLSDKSLEVKQKYIDMEGLQSRIVRTAVLQRILRG